LKKVIKLNVNIVIALIIVLSLSISGSVMAMEENIEVTGASNVEVSMTEVPVFTPATHYGAINVGSFIGFSGSNENVSIIDATGTNSGWKFSLAVTDFYQQNIDDPTDGVSEQMDVFISAGDWMSFNIDNVQDNIMDDGSYTLIPGIGGSGETIAADKVLYFGSPLPSVTPHCSTTATDTINLITVEPGYGAGKYIFDLNCKITIHDWLPMGAKIDSSASSGSRFDDMTVGAGDKVQVFAGIYTTNITYSASCNPVS